MIDNKYDTAITQIIDLAQPQTLAELGVHKGHRASLAIRRAQQYHPSIHYTGYDLWELMEDNETAINGKGQPPHKSVVDARLNKIARHSDVIELIQGNTEHTVAEGTHYDFVFIDADHRLEAIERDYSRTKCSGTILFDDVFKGAPRDQGAEQLVSKLKKSPAVTVYELPTNHVERWNNWEVWMAIVVNHSYYKDGTQPDYTSIAEHYTAHYDV